MKIQWIELSYSKDDQTFTFKALDEGTRALFTGKIEGVVHDTAGWFEAASVTLERCQIDPRHIQWRDYPGGLRGEITRDDLDEAALRRLLCDGYEITARFADSSHGLAAWRRELERTGILTEAK